MDSFEARSLEHPRAAPPRWRPWHRLRRHARLISFLACVGLPAFAAGIYEYGFAADQYVSECQFIVRVQAPQTTAPGGLSAMFSGGNPMLALIEDSEVVVQYIKSGQMLRDLPPDISLAQIYATPRADWPARMGADLPPERQLLYWRRMVQPSFDLSSGIITVKVRAFSAPDAAHLAASVLAAAERLVDEMSQTARRNALDYATQTANAAQAKLAQDEAKLAAYRNRYQILFPDLTAQQSSTVGGALLLGLNQDQASLAALRAQGQTDASPQVKTLQTRIAAAQAQVDALEAQLTAENGGKQLSLASVLTGYDTLTAEEKLDEQLYDSDMASLQDASNMAAERSLYLESFVQPALPSSSTYPVRWLVMLETALAGFIAWILLVLTASIVRDQLD